MTATADGNTEFPENEKSRMDSELDNSTAIDLGNGDPDDSKAQLINANGGAGVGDHHIDVKIVDGTVASSEGEVSFSGLGKDEVMKYAEEPFWKRLRLILFILFWVGWIAMLVTAIGIIAFAPRCPPRPDLKWYQTETVYQVVPESFKDSDGDGIGDFDGLDDKLDYINDDLGIKAIWLSSIYKSDTDADGVSNELGVINHKEIRDSFGATPEKLKSWMKSLRKLGKKVIMDLIPNQSSKNHPWFQKSRNGDAKYKDYYIWVAADSASSPPNKWENSFGEPAWTYDDKRKAFYFHQFEAEYPDLNLNNSAVVEEIKDIMKFWFDKGVGGFHIKDVEYLVENPDLSAIDGPGRLATRNYNGYGTHAFLDELREVANSYSDKPGRERFLFATVYHFNKDKTMSLWGPKDDKRLHIVMPLMETFDSDCNANCVEKMFNEQLTDDRYQWLGLGFGNQYVNRVATRVNDPKKLHAAHALQLLMPGTAFNYYGDEFGMRDGNQDSIKRHKTPMQWNNGHNAGFSKSNSTYIAVSDDYVNINVKAGFAHFQADTTPLQGFRDLVQLRKRPSFQWGKTEMSAPNANLFMFTRKAERFPYFLTMMNMGKSKLTVSLKDSSLESKEEGTVQFHSRDEDEVGMKLNVHDNSILLEAGDVVVIEFEADDE